MANRNQRKQIAEETVEVLHRGSYTLPDGSTVSIAAPLNNAIAGTQLFTPDRLGQLIDSLPPFSQVPTEFRVENCTTFAAAAALVDRDAERDAERDPLCLNFASAKNPGGGFLSGSQAQEECLARASGLYACIQPQQPYYEVNRHCGTSLYTDHMIYSPKVPVFRDDGDEFVGSPRCVSIITAPAVNAGAVRNNEPANVGKVAETMKARMTGVLAIARHFGHTHLVLGAWGCGVFANDPADVALWFRESLTEDARFGGAFQQVVFAVLDRTKNLATCRAFQACFVSLAE